jgi:diguanylate cyclase (GGDEF)-like protein
VEGALIARLSIDFLSEFTSLRGYKNQGISYIISDEGSFISIPNKEEFENFIPLKDLSKQNSDQPSGFDRLSYEDTSYLTGFSRVAETSWTFYISVSEKKALEPLHRLTYILVVGLMTTLIISAITAWIFIRRLTNPIESLDKLMSEGASGNLNIRFESKTNDEIGRLGESFNRMMDKIKSLTQYDALTGLLNQHVLEKEIYRAVHEPSPKPFGLIMVAITHFSLINETYGYVTGDLILVEISNRIKKSVGIDCELFRYKGDEFVILCSNSDLNRMDTYSRKSLKNLMKTYELNEKNIELNITIGLYKWDVRLGHDDPLKSLAHAKNYAKELGGNQIQVFDPDMHNRILNERKLESDLLTGLKENQFYLLYQPLFSVKNEEVVEMEALIRWKHPERGLVFPDQFITLAEKSNTIVAMDLWVIDQVCKDMKSFKSPLNEVIMSINITSKTFEAPYFIERLKEIISHYNIDPKYLQFEITERMVIENMDESIEKLKSLRSMGISIALDDFGIGYSSLSYIVRLPLDRIKIDRSFVQNMHESHEAKLIVSAIINLCKSLNLIVIAEGVELQEELDSLIKLECDIVQGYFFSKPIELDLIKETYFT